MQLDRDTIYTLATLVCLALMIGAALFVNRKAPAETFTETFNDSHRWN